MSVQTWLSEFASSPQMSPLFQGGRGGHRPPPTVPHRQRALADELLGKGFGDATMGGYGADADEQSGPGYHHALVPIFGDEGAAIVMLPAFCGNPARISLSLALERVSRSGTQVGTR